MGRIRYENKNELVAMAKTLREDGLSFAEIAEKLGVKAQSTIHAWLNPDSKKRYSLKYCNANREKLNEKSIAYCRDNKEARSLTQRNYHERNIEKINEAARIHRINNREKELERGRIYRENNKEKIAENHKTRRENNIERELARESQYRKNNKEKIAASAKKYYETHKEIIFELCRKRRSSVDAGIVITKDQYESIWEEQGGRCFYCGSQMVRDKDLCRSPYYCHVEHIDPFDNGGSHVFSNVVYACRKCNQSKGKKLVESWMPSIMKKIDETDRLDYSIERANIRWLL